MRVKCKDLGVSPKDVIETMFKAFLDQEVEAEVKRTW